MIRNMMRHLSDSFKDLKRNGWMTIASVISVTITLTVLTIFVAFLANIQQFSTDAKKNVTVSVFVATEATKKDEKKLEDKLKELPNVDKVKYSSKDEEYDKFIKQNKDWQGLFTKENNPLYSVFTIYANNPKNIKGIVRQAKVLPNVIQVQDGGEMAAKVIKLADSIKIGGTIAGIILLIISILLVSNTIKLTIIARQEEIKIMKLVGATKGYIRWPFILEGAWVGLLGSIIPLITIVIGYNYLYKQLQPTLMQAHYHMLLPSTIFSFCIILTMFVGILIGAFGSMRSMRKFLNA